MDHDNEAKPSLQDQREIFEADSGLMRLYRGIWFGTISLFAVWLALVSYYNL